MPPDHKKDNVQTYTISQIADQLEISTRTIRFYEEKGLIMPERTIGNQRIYTPRNKARLKLILRGKRFGFSLDEIAEMIGMADANLNEIEQIEKSLIFGDAKLK
ncbi:MAG: MerR family transcriptional regulator, partial [Desulfobacula sp.]|nr:MerR family transcriptional regulator [Desulfobacula sp.]